MKVTKYFKFLFKDSISLKYQAREHLWFGRKFQKSDDYQHTWGVPQLPTTTENRQRRMMYSFDLTIDSRCAKIPWSKGPRKLCAFIYVLQCTVQLLSYLVDECIGFKFWCEQNMPHMARAISFIKNTFVCLFDVGYRQQVHPAYQKL